MEKNYRPIKEEYKQPVKVERHLPTEKKEKPTHSPFSLGFLCLKNITYSPLMGILGLIRPPKRIPFQHQEKDVPKKIRAVLGERLDNLVELESQEEGRRIFAVRTKRGNQYEVRFRDNLSKVIGYKRVS